MELNVEGMPRDNDRRIHAYMDLGLDHYHIWRTVGDEWRYSMAYAVYDHLQSGAFTDVITANFQDIPNSPDARTNPECRRYK